MKVGRRGGGAFASKHPDGFRSRHAPVIPRIQMHTRKMVEVPPKKRGDKRRDT